MDLNNTNTTNRMVIYTGADEVQVRQGTGNDPREVLTVGSMYEVVDLDIQDWSSTIQLKGIDGRFNTVVFDEASDIGRDDQVSNNPHIDNITRIGQITIEILDLERDVLKIQECIENMKNEKQLLIEKVTGITFFKR